MSYEPKRILVGAPNARDLGGLETADGRTVKYGRLIRSGALDGLTAEDVGYLESIPLRRIVDFRLNSEVLDKRDIVPEGAEWIHCPILQDKTAGISREKPPSAREIAERVVLMAQRLMPQNPDGMDKMRSLYPILVGERHCIEHYREFFNILLENTEGALLYHCTMGKDRVGTATVLLLTALGVPRGEILRDYMLTNERCAEGTARLIHDAREFTDDEDELYYIYCLDRVDESFFNAVYEAVEASSGSMEAFLEKEMGLDAEKLERLRAMYLM